MNMRKMLPALALCLLCPACLCAAAMDARVRKVPEELMERVFAEPAAALPAVVQSLTRGVSDTAAKVKVLHDWICDVIAYDTDIFDAPANVQRQDYEAVLKKRKGICSGYTNLMNEMCRLAGVEAIGVEGYSKGFGYLGYLGEKPDHAWNAVRIGNRWQQVDVTWDAGYVERKAFIKRYSTEWLYRTPEQFVYSHLPVTDEYQYLKEPRTKERFVAEPYVPGAFFDYGLSFGMPAPGYANEVGAAVAYGFHLAKSGTLVVGSLTDMDSGARVENAVWVDRMGNRIAADVDVPGAGRYRAHLLARRKGEAKNPAFFSAADYEGAVLPGARQLAAAKKITQRELDYLEASYYAVPENGRYYLREDLFAAARNAAVTKVLGLLERNSGSYEEVLYFDVCAAEGYAGYGDGAVRFPSVYDSYNETQNTHLLSPVAGVLEPGSVQAFEINSKDFTAMGLVSGGALTPIPRNAKTGRFALEFTVPDDVDTVAVYGSKNGRNYMGLWYYRVE